MGRCRFPRVDPLFRPQLPSLLSTRRGVIGTGSGAAVTVDPLPRLPIRGAARRSMTDRHFPVSHWTCPRGVLDDAGVPSVVAATRNLGFPTPIRAPIAGGASVPGISSTITSAASRIVPTERDSLSNRCCPSSLPTGWPLMVTMPLRTPLAAGMCSCSRVRRRDHGLHEVWRVLHSIAGVATGSLADTSRCRAAPAASMSWKRKSLAAMCLTGVFILGTPPRPG